LGEKCLIATDLFDYLPDAMEEVDLDRKNV
jgi:hypothetical protein